MATSLSSVINAPSSMLGLSSEVGSADIPEIGVATVLEAVSERLGMPIAANQFLETGNLDRLTAQVAAVSQTMGPPAPSLVNNVQGETLSGTSAPAALSQGSPPVAMTLPTPIIGSDPRLPVTDGFFPAPFLDAFLPLPMRPSVLPFVQDPFLRPSDLGFTMPMNDSLDFVPKGCSRPTTVSGRAMRCNTGYMPSRPIGTTTNSIASDNALDEPNGRSVDLDNIPAEEYAVYVAAAILVSALHEVVGESNAIRLFLYLIARPNNIIERFSRQQRLTELYNLATQVGVRGGPARQQFYQEIGFDTNRFITVPFDEFFDQVRSSQTGVEKRCLRRVYCRYMELTPTQYEIDPVLVASLAWQMERSTVDCKVATDLTVDAISDQIEADGFDFYESPPFRRELTKLVNRYHQPSSTRAPTTSSHQHVTRPVRPTPRPMVKPVVSHPEPSCNGDGIVFGGGFLDEGDNDGGNISGNEEIRRLDAGEEWIPKSYRNKASTNPCNNPGLTSVIGNGSSDIYFHYGERSVLIVVPSINAGPVRQTQFETETQKLLQKYADAEYRINLVEEFVGSGQLSLYGDLMEHCSCEMTQWFAEAGLINVNLSMTANRTRTRCVLICLLTRRDREWVLVPSYDQNGVPLSFYPNTMDTTTIQKICYRIFTDAIVKTILAQLSQAEMALVVNRLGIPVNNPETGSDLIHQVFTTLIVDEPRFAGNLAIAVLNSQSDTGVLDPDRLVIEVDRVIATDPTVVQRISERFMPTRPPMV